MYDAWFEYERDWDHVALFVPFSVRIMDETDRARVTTVLYSRVWLAPVAFCVRIWDKSMSGGGRTTIGAEPVVIEEGVSSHIKILPVTYQLLSMVSVTEPVVPPLSFMPATLISNVCSLPSERTPSQGVMSVSCSRRSKASIPTIGRQRPGWTDVSISLFISDFQPYSNTSSKDNRKRPLNSCELTVDINLHFSPR